MKLYFKRTRMFGPTKYHHILDFVNLKDFNDYMKHFYRINFNDILKSDNSIGYKKIMINLNLKNTNLILK